MRDGGRVPSGGPICLVAAMESELRHALGAVENVEASTVGPWKVWTGRMDGLPVVLLLCGVGMANAASALTALIMSNRPRAIINFGCSGAHTPELHPGDVVIASSVAAAGSRTILPDGSERYGGFLFDVGDERQMPESIEADPQLLAAATKAGETIEWEARAIDYTPRITVGPVASGDIWTQHAPRIEQLHRELGSLCEEMEAASLAQVSAIYQVPFLAVKDISNNELIASSPMGDAWPLLEDFADHLGETAFAIMRATLRRLADAGMAE